MEKERKITNQFLKKLLFLIIVLCLFPSKLIGAINSGSVIVSNAEKYIGRIYVWGYPTNKEAEYGGGGIFSPEGEYSGGFDCSGLVSWSAGLRKHYFTSELSTITDATGWGDLQAGDLLLGSGHVLIFEKWEQKVGSDENTWKVGVIHASYSKGQVRRDTFTVSSCKAEGWSPRRFKNDTTPPQVKFDGAENGKCYKNDVTLTVNGRDTIEGPTYAYGLYGGNKFKTKTFKEIGRYEIQGQAIDWAKNEKEDNIVFYIDTTPPTISISGASNGATYFMPVSLTITYLVTDDKDPNPTVTANYPSGTVFDSEGSYAVVVKGKGLFQGSRFTTLTAKASRCEITSHFCEKISIDNYFTSIATYIQF